MGLVGGCEARAASMAGELLSGDPANSHHFALSSNKSAPHLCVVGINLVLTSHSYVAGSP